MKKTRKFLAVLFALMMVTGIVGAAPATQAKAAEFNAYLMFTDTNWGWSNWDAAVANTSVTGDGTYTVTLTKDALAEAPATDAATGASVFCVDIEGLFAAAADPSALSVSDVKILCDGTEIAVDQSLIAVGDIEEKGNLRIELFNLYGTTAEAAPINVESLTWAESISVEFTLAGFVEGDGTAAEAPAEEPTEEAPALSVDLGGTYHAYIGFQSPTYSFRNAFDDATYGRDSEYFNQICGWNGNDLIVRDGVLTDAEIAGNGTYTVSVDGLDLSGDFDSEEIFNLIFLSTDIPNSGEITVSDLVLKVNGSTVDCAPIVSPDSPNWLTMLIQNKWNADVAEIGYYQVPPTSMSITFTVSGFSYDKAADVEPDEAPTTDSADTGSDVQTPSTDDTSADAAEESDSSSTTIIIIVVVVVVVVAAAVIVVMSKKKKK